MPGLVPLTDRLEQAFAARVSDLPEETRLLLLTAALERRRAPERGPGGRQRRRCGTGGCGPIWIPPLEAAIVDLDERTVRFRHPLMRSAVRQAASVRQRRRVHEALADALDVEPDRRVWHRAALIAGTHEDVAAELEEAGRRARRRGAVSVAATALRRAAELSDPAQRPGA